MSVQKFRSIAEMNAAPVRAGAGEAFDRFVRHCARYRAISPTVYPRGVFKFRDIVEAQAARERVKHDVTHRHGQPCLSGYGSSFMRRNRSWKRGSERTPAKIAELML